LRVAAVGQTPMVMAAQRDEVPYPKIVGFRGWVID